MNENCPTLKKPISIVEDCFIQPKTITYIATH